MLQQRQVIASLIECSFARLQVLCLIEQGVDVWNVWRANEPSIRPDLREAKLDGRNLSQADLSGAYLRRASLMRTDLSGANLTQADLGQTTLFEANLRGANLSGANLAYASLDDVDITNTNLTGSRIYGVSAWGLKLSDQTSQRNLIITKTGESEITVDNIEIAQFIYLLLHNQKIRDVIDTIPSKAVLILGRFSEERKLVLDAIRDELRKYDYLPILFDFDPTTNQTIIETVKTLAGMSRFVIADITDCQECASGTSDY